MVNRKIVISGGILFLFSYYSTLMIILSFLVAQTMIIQL